GGGRTQAALVELLADGGADALLGEVAADARVVRAVLQGRLLPAPAAVGGEIAAGIEVALDAGGLAGDEEQQGRQQQETAEHGENLRGRAPIQRLFGGFGKRRIS